VTLRRRIKTHIMWFPLFTQSRHRLATHHVTREMCQLPPSPPPNIIIPEDGISAILPKSWNTSDILRNAFMCMSRWHKLKVWGLLQPSLGDRSIHCLFTFSLKVETEMYSETRSSSEFNTYFVAKFPVFPHTLVSPKTCRQNISFFAPSPPAV
jgi:hypothetical protein